jgi:hypothetical protein
VFEAVTHRCTLKGQSAAALKFADPRVMALLQGLVLFFLLPEGFSNALLREHVARLMGKRPGDYSQGQMSYDLRRLKLHGLIQRIASTHRYEVNQKGFKVALFFNKVHRRILTSGLSQLFDPVNNQNSQPLVKAFNKVENAIEAHIQAAKLAA